MTLDVGGALASAPAVPHPADRLPHPRRYLMVAPEFFAVEYAINPWMDTSTPVDTDRAVAQWETLRRTYLDLGHRVDVLAPVPGLPDMVYAANGAMIAGSRAVVARFAHPQRAAEAAAHAQWLRDNGFDTVETRHANEGQGDLLLVGQTLLAGHGFRTDRRAHAEIAAALGLPVVSLELVDPRFYHLDTALSVLDDATVAYYPPAFAPSSRAVLEQLFPTALQVSTADAYVLGLNVVSDGHHVVLPSAATGFAEELRAAGFAPVPVDLSELLKGGGSVKCCTLEVHP